MKSLLWTEIHATESDRDALDSFLKRNQPITVWFQWDGERYGIQSESLYPRAEGGASSVPMRTNHEMARENVVLRARKLLAAQMRKDQHSLAFVGVEEGVI